MRLEGLIENEYRSLAPQERYVPDFIENHEGDAEEIKALYTYIDRSEKSMFEQGFMRGIEEGKRQCGRTLATEVIKEEKNRKRFWFVMFVTALAALIWNTMRNRR